jgi:hypothetical protein
VATWASLCGSRSTRRNLNYRPHVQDGLHDDERQALRAEGFDPDDPAVVAVIDLLRWELSLTKRNGAAGFLPPGAGIHRPAGWSAPQLQLAGTGEPAVSKCQRNDDTFPSITPHDLRHTAASLAVSAGANVKAVQRMLGHARASMTLDVHADLFDAGLDDVAINLDAAIRSAAYLLRTGNDTT